MIFFRATRNIPDRLCENIKNEPDSGLIADKFSNQDPETVRGDSF